jgi:predicted Zn finger-like uncharacterized protein
MSLTTRCPACQTLFRLVPDQLRISEGWVRCGQCNEVFDASRPQSTPATVTDPATSEPVDLTLSSLTPSQIPLGEALIAPAETAEILSQIEPNDLEDPDRQIATELGEPSFLQAQQDTSAWRRPLARILVLALGLSLLLGLAGQVAFHERNRIVALQPGLKDLMLTLCAPLNCSLSPLQQKDAVVIDGAAFAKVRPDAYRLNFTLRNTAPTSVAAPAIELTLTDSLDQPVVRRIFSAPEFGIQSNALAPATEWTASIALEVKSSATAERIVGYRLLAFYL